MVLISACLLGVNCKYNGKNNLKEEVKKHFKEQNIVPICPEQLGGLSTPRFPAEIKGGDGDDVLKGKAKVINIDGVDVTAEFIKGAYETLKIAKSLGATKAILKARSPSCGYRQIYNGSFSGTLSDGRGVTTALLIQNGIEICDEEIFYKNYV